MKKQNKVQIVINSASTNRVVGADYEVLWAVETVQQLQQAPLSVHNVGLQFLTTSKPDPNAFKRWSQSSIIKEQFPSPAGLNVITDAILSVKACVVPVNACQ